MCSSFRAGILARTSDAREALKYSYPVWLRMFKMTHQTKLVVKPPASNTTRTGSPCHRPEVPCRIVRAFMESPAANPYAKQALITPEKVATSNPFFKANSLIEVRFCSFDISCSLDTPA